jgi:hypothetical protein
MKELNSLMAEWKQRVTALNAQLRQLARAEAWDVNGVMRQSEQIKSEMLTEFRALKRRHSEIDHVALAVQEEKYREVAARILRDGYEASKYLELEGDEDKWQEWQTQYREYVKACRDVDVSQDMQAVYSQFLEVYARYGDMVQPEDWELLSACPLAQKS